MDLLCCGSSRSKKVKVSHGEYSGLTVHVSGWGAMGVADLCM